MLQAEVDGPSERQILTMRWRMERMTEALRLEMAPTGVLRAGINVGNPVIAQRDAQGADPRGVGPALAARLAKQLNIAVHYVVYETAGKLADAAKDQSWDVAFLAIDPARAVDIEFTAAYVLIEGTYMVPRNSPLHDVADFDREGLKIAVGLKTAYDLFLTRTLERARLVGQKAPPPRSTSISKEGSTRSPAFGSRSKPPRRNIPDSA
jgi:ABC-type amino acid transport substrate-binding protein